MANLPRTHKVQCLLFGHPLCVRDSDPHAHGGELKTLWIPRALGGLGFSSRLIPCTRGVQGFRLGWSRVHWSLGVVANTSSSTSQPNSNVLRSSIISKPPKSFNTLNPSAQTLWYFGNWGNKARSTTWPTDLCSRHISSPKICYSWSFGS